MPRFLKWSASILVVIFLGVQFVPVERTNPPVDSTMRFQARVNVPAHIDGIIRRSCYDCHSHETQWPWYSYVAPASWLVTTDVKNGRRMLNFSDWSYDRFRSVGRLDQMAQEVHQGRMPPPQYLMMHPHAKLSEAEKTSIINWVEVVREEIMYPPKEMDTTAKK